MLVLDSEQTDERIDFQSYVSVFFYKYLKTFFMVE